VQVTSFIETKHNLPFRLSLSPSHCFL